MSPPLCRASRPTPRRHSLMQMHDELAACAPCPGGCGARLAARGRPATPDARRILLSFAQFEREVIGERVRDKIAASKRRGIWVGGPVPLGYRCIDKKLVVVPEEAEAVRTIFTRYLGLARWAP